MIIIGTHKQSDTHKLERVLDQLRTMLYKCDSFLSIELECWVIFLKINFIARFWFDYVNDNIFEVPAIAKCTENNNQSILPTQAISDHCAHAHTQIHIYMYLPHRMSVSLRLRLHFIRLTEL